MRLKTIIRGARAADLAGLHPVIERTYRGDSARQGWTHEADLLSGRRTSLDVLEAILSDPVQRLLVAVNGTRPVGCVAIGDRGGGLVHLGQLCVDPLLQTGGKGRRLMAAAERTARVVFGADRIELAVIDSRAELIAWYQRRGYTLTGERRDFPVPVDPPLHMVVLEKPLVAREVVRTAIPV
ncbi:GNAT family N-acetyltransferase [Sphingomonas sp.]|uniref:GNAT family N-acetyltransferase n=1 Tax=Sphingomonas sp. TaxID=28214 RepID=UPI002DD62997|nr:GNAT family N-acetyltransferase [Sphingomonas sp.]